MPLRYECGSRDEATGIGTVNTFLQAAGAASGMAELRAAVDEACGALGFDYFAFVHHIRFGRPSVENVRLSNYPVEWVAVLRQRDRPGDPVLRAAERSSAAFRWRDLERWVRLSEQDRRILAQAGRHGIGDGFTVPNHVPGEAFGSCHFSVRVGKALPEDNIGAAQLIGSFGFEAARRLIERDREPSEAYIDPAPLTDRQRECLLFAARGKSDSVIAQILDIKPRTVNEHIEAAKRRYCVATRSQLVVRALFRSEILFSEALG